MNAMTPPRRPPKGPRKRPAATAVAHRPRLGDQPQTDRSERYIAPVVLRNVREAGRFICIERARR